jgi:DNA-binding MarR family transcriptional regulator/GNAT superfamily N-acetyltransferase
MTDEQVRQFRSFNRAVTQRIGALNDRFLGQNRPLGEARLLFEIGREGAEVRELRARLALDSGYVSRLLRSLEEQGLAETIKAPSDGRVRRAQLTRAGLAEVAELNRRSDELANSILAALSVPQRDRLVAAMAEVERLMEASAVAIDVEAPTSPVAQSCLDEYFRELDQRFESGFDPARSISADAGDLTPPAGLFLVARIRGRPVGCGALKISDGGVGEVKRMWVAGSARGLGIGRRILEALETHARAHGLSVLHLETNRTLKEAQSLYRKYGYQEVEPFNDEPYAHHWFEKKLG